MIGTLLSQTIMVTLHDGYTLHTSPVRLVEDLPEWGELWPLPGHRWGHSHCTTSRGLPMSATSSSRQDMAATLQKSIDKYMKLQFSL